MSKEQSKAQSDKQNDETVMKADMATFELSEASPAVRKTAARLMEIVGADVVDEKHPARNEFAGAIEVAKSAGDEIGVKALTALKEIAAEGPIPEDNRAVIAAAPYQDPSLKLGSVEAEALAKDLGKHGAYELAGALATEVAEIKFRETIERRDIETINRDLPKASPEVRALAAEIVRDGHAMQTAHQRECIATVEFARTINDRAGMSVASALLNLNHIPDSVRESVESQSPQLDAERSGDLASYMKSKAPKLAESFSRQAEQQADESQAQGKGDDGLGL